MTPHLEAEKGAYADVVLLPGDPLRAEWLAETFLDNAGCVNRVRNMLGFTGDYQGRRVSVQGTGMGQPSLAIYTHELITFYGVKTLIRFGTCGALSSGLKIGDMVLATTASTDSATNRTAFSGHDFAPGADFDLLRRLAEMADRLDIHLHAGGILSTDQFYADEDSFRPWIDHGVMAVEMESNTLYTIAARHGVRAATILTVSDHIVDGGSMTPPDRQQSLEAMARLTLAAVKELPDANDPKTVLV